MFQIHTLTLKETLIIAMIILYCIVMHRLVANWKVDRLMQKKDKKKHECSTILYI